MIFILKEPFPFSFGDAFSVELIGRTTPQSTIHTRYLQQRYRLEKASYTLFLAFFARLASVVRFGVFFVGCLFCLVCLLQYKHIIIQTNFKILVKSYTNKYGFLKSTNSIIYHEALIITTADFTKELARHVGASRRDTLILAFKTLRCPRGSFSDVFLL